MGLYIEGIVPVDDEWKRMKKVWDACQEAGIDVPDEVAEFFDWKSPDDDGMSIELEDGTHYERFSEEMVDGISIVLKHLPKKVQVIKVRYHY